MKFKIYYHFDMDGMFSRVIMEKYIRKQYAYKLTNKDLVIDSYELDHSKNDISQISLINGDEELVIFVDYSFSENTLDIFSEIVKITDGGKKLLWIDHHDSSIDLVNKHILNPDDPIKLSYNNYIVSKAGSGAYLAWAVYQSEDLLILEKDSKTELFHYNAYDMYNSLRYVPSAVQYVSDYDTFEHRLEPFTSYFEYAYDACEHKHFIAESFLDFDGKWDCEDELLISDDLKRVIHSISDFMDNGHIIWDYAKVNNKKVISVQGYESCIKDLKTGNMEKVYVCNRFTNSHVFGDLYNQYKYVIVFHFNGIEFKYSIFSNTKKFKDADCQKYAEQFGGGGHKGAAGWRSDEIMFMKDTFILDGMESWMSCNSSAANGCEAQFMDN